MRSLHVAFTSLLIVISTAAVASAQFGLCGAPELVQIPKAQRPLLPQYTYGNQYVYDSRQAASAQQHYQPVPVAYRQPVAQQPQPTAQSQPMPQPNVVGTTLYETRPVARIAAGQDPTCSPCSPSCAASCSDDSYFAGRGSCLSGCGGGCSPWYASFTALMMGRNQANGIWTTYETVDMTNQMMKSDFGLQWKAGGEIRVGRRFCCDAWALEFVYWTLDPFEGLATASVAGGTVSSTLEVTEVEFGAVNAAAIFHNSAEQKLWRYDEIHNFEINLLRGGFHGCDSWPWGVQWSAGLRYFSFRDRLIYGAVAQNNTWGSGGGIHEAYINDHVKNNLFAFQFGFDAKSQRQHNVQFFLSPKIAIGCNHIENEYQIYRGDGVGGQPTAASGMTGSFPVSSTKDVFSLITQIDVGLDWQFAKGWSARVGYRLMMATGMGLADNQIPFYIVDIPEIQDIDHNAELILHGGFAGITYNF